jgi:RNA polymerase sigma factor (sigma-70 family)
MIEPANCETAQSLPEELERIFREHSALVYRTAYGITHKTEDAEDILQSLFLRLFQCAIPPDFICNPKAYLYRSAVNATLNLVRSRRRLVLTSDFEDVEATTGGHRMSEFSVAHEHLRAALAELHPKAAETFILRYVHGYSVTEVAELLGTSSSTVAVSLFRSRARLKKSIRKYLGEQS